MYEKDLTAEEEQRQQELLKQLEELLMREGLASSYTSTNVPKDIQQLLLEQNVNSNY
jgi:hypothetical protein